MSPSPEPALICVYRSEIDQSLCFCCLGRLPDHPPVYFQGGECILTDHYDILDPQTIMLDRITSLHDMNLYYVENSAMLSSMLTVGSPGLIDVETYRGTITLTPNETSTSVQAFFATLENHPGDQEATIDLWLHASTVQQTQANPGDFIWQMQSAIGTTTWRWVTP